jgi:hypothetical protein
MTLTLDLSPQLEQQLSAEATQHGLPIGEYALRVLEEHVSPVDRRKNVVQLIQSWIDEGDADEQDETREYLIRVLDEDCSSDRKLFPEELKGITW